MRRRTRQYEGTEINITPMLDIVFIMLIFFIVTASFTRETGADIAKPRAAEALSLDKATILIAVRPNDDIWMAGRRIELNELRQIVERARAENPEGNAVIVADRAARIGRVTQVVDQIRLAGVDGIAISAERHHD